MSIIKCSNGRQKKGKEKTKQGNKLLMRKKQRLKTGETVNSVEYVQNMKSKMIRGFFRQNAS